MAVVVGCFREVEKVKFPGGEVEEGAMRLVVPGFRKHEPRELRREVDWIFWG